MTMKRISLFLFAIFTVATAMAQLSARDEIAANPNLAGSNYLAYPGPTQMKLTPAPKGYKPIYISHYGRHGSRYHIGKGAYHDALNILQRADSLDKLTPTGKDVLRRVRMMTEEARKRDGELTELGAEQHRDIARRMYERFPEVFEGKTNIEARSTIIIRCILSMTNELMELKARNPQLTVFHDASDHDMWYMNLDKTELQKQRDNEYIRDEYKRWTDEHVDYKPLMKRLFSDDKYVEDSVDVGLLGYRMFRLAAMVQNSEIRHKMTLWDIYTNDEIYNLWMTDNVSWYQRYGYHPHNGGQPNNQRNLLRRFVEQADSCLKLERPGATLRFGHEVVVLPLACIMGLNGADLCTDDMNELVEKGWVNYRIFPMASNIQMVFYRRNAADSDVLVKVLLNENEATLPPSVKPVSAPYYRWSDVRQFFMSRIGE